LETDIRFNAEPVSLGLIFRNGGRFRLFNYTRVQSSYGTSHMTPNAAAAQLRKGDPLGACNRRIRNNLAARNDAAANYP
jgi:hypothetical protein